MWDGFAHALAAMADWHVAAGLGLGIVVGYCVGSLPGLTSSIGIAPMVPFTFAMSPVVSITMLVTLYMATEYAGAIPAILVNTPGIPAAAVSALGGYPMRLRGEAGTALTTSILSAAFGSITNTLMLIVTATCLVRAGVRSGRVFRPRRARAQPGVLARQRVDAERLRRPVLWPGGGRDRHRPARRRQPLRADRQHVERNPVPAGADRPVRAVERVRPHRNRRRGAVADQEVPPCPASSA